MSQPAKLRVGIIFGGQSAEHEISILSARNVLAALDRSRFEPVLIGIDKGGHWLAQDEQRLLASSGDPRLAHIEDGTPTHLSATLAPSPLSRRAAIDVAFPVLHGTLGEDGAMQGLFEVAGIPYVGAGVLGSAIGMDKDVMKRLLRDAGIPVADFRTIRRDRFDANPAQVCHDLVRLGLPMFVKPVNAGSSVGISKVHAAAQLEVAIRQAFEYDIKVIVETAIAGREIELAVLGGEPASVSGAVEIIVEHPDGFYSYDAKYIDEAGARLELPAKISADELKRAQGLALQTFDVLECEGLARIDMFLQRDGRLLINEINTLPGFTSVSMYPKLWAHAGLSPTQLITHLIERAQRRAQQRSKLKR